MTRNPKANDLQDILTKTNSHSISKRHSSPINNSSDSLYLNKSIDWQKLGHVTPAKATQGKCGSCTAYAIVGALEAQYFKKTNLLKNFSEQFLIDCNLLTPHLCKEGATLTDRTFKFLLLCLIPKLILNLFLQLKSSFF